MVYQYEETKTIRAYDVDFNNRIKISSVFNLLQDIASVHADKLGLGYKDLNDLDMVSKIFKKNIALYPESANVYDNDSEKWMLRYKKKWLLFTIKKRSRLVSSQYGSKKNV
jgi:hypothetical protein